MSNNIIQDYAENHIDTLHKKVHMWHIGCRIKLTLSIELAIPRRRSLPDHFDSQVFPQMSVLCLNTRAFADLLLRQDQVYSRCSSVRLRSCRRRIKTDDLFSVSRLRQTSGRCLSRREGAGSTQRKALNNSCLHEAYFAQGAQLD